VGSWAALHARNEKHQYAYRWLLRRVRDFKTERQLATFQDAMDAYLVHLRGRVNAAAASATASKRRRVYQQANQTTAAQRAALWPTEDSRSPDGSWDDSHSPLNPASAPVGMEEEEECSEQGEVGAGLSAESDESASTASHHSSNGSANSRDGAVQPTTVDLTLHSPNGRSNDGAASQPSPLPHVFSSSSHFQWKVVRDTFSLEAATKSLEASAREAALASPLAPQRSLEEAEEECEQQRRRIEQLQAEVLLAEAVRERLQQEVSRLQLVNAVAEEQGGLAAVRRQLAAEQAAVAEHRKELVWFGHKLKQQRAEFRAMRLQLAAKQTECADNRERANNTAQSPPSQLEEGQHKRPAVKRPARCEAEGQTAGRLLDDAAATKKQRKAERRQRVAALEAELKTVREQLMASQKALQPVKTQHCTGGLLNGGSGSGSGEVGVESTTPTNAASVLSAPPLPPSFTSNSTFWSPHPTMQPPLMPVMMYGPPLPPPFAYSTAPPMHTPQPLPRPLPLHSHAAAAAARPP